MSGVSWEAEAEELRASRPRHVLFLCVANSARGAFRDVRDELVRRLSALFTR